MLRHDNIKTKTVLESDFGAKKIVLPHSQIIDLILKINTISRKVIHISDIQLMCVDLVYCIRYSFGARIFIVLVLKVYYILFFS